MKRIVILTTNTLHHRYFINTILENNIIINKGLFEVTFSTITLLELINKVFILDCPSCPFTITSILPVSCAKADSKYMLHKIMEKIKKSMTNIVLYVILLLKFEFILIHHHIYAYVNC